MRFSALLCSLPLALVLPSAASGQLVRQAATTLSALPADLPSATGYTTANALGTLSFSSPICLANAPGETHRLFVVERGGTVQVVTNLAGTPAKSTYLSLAPLLGTGEALSTDGENGFLALVFHPQFATNRTLFVYYSITRTGEGTNIWFQRLARIVVTDAVANTATVQSHTPLLTIRDRETNHNGGDLAFGADGYLYLSLGDEGASNDSRNNARFITSRNDGSVQRTGFWGQLLRLDVDLRPENLAPNSHSQASVNFSSAVHAGTYKIPADNPFIGLTSWHNQPVVPSGIRTEIWATGLRNPFRFSFDPPTGRLFLGDVGQGAREEINIVQKGNDLGWSWREGFIAFGSSPGYPLAGNSNAPPAQGFTPTPPIFDYDRTNNAVIIGNCVTGGVVYRGNQLTELQGAYLFNDVYTGGGTIAALRETSPGVWTGQRIGATPQIVDWGTHPATGEPLLCSLQGTVRRLVRSGTTGTPPPALLSQTGAFTAPVASLAPQAGVVPYTPNVAFWSDYAHKSRWFAIKNTADTVGYSADGNWTFPTGMVWVKHFDFDLERGNPATRRKLETRFLVKTATDVYGLSYKWRADQSDADLVTEEGLSEAISGASPAQTWRYPSRGECKTCHTPVAGFALSFNTRQLNRAALFGTQTLNQIAAMRDARTSGGAPASYLSAAPATTNGLPFFAAATDTTQSLEHRVRSYLAVNCVQCHQPGGAAQGNWNARPNVPTDAANMIDALLVNNLGNSANRFLASGSVAHSIAFQRVQGIIAPRMPPLATSQRDLAAEQLLTDWIRQLPSRKSFTQWQVTHFGSAGAPNAQLGADPDGDGDRNSLEFLRGTSPVLPQPPLAPVSGVMNGDFALQFTHPANRSCLVEATNDFQTWTLWDVPGNAPSFPSADTQRTLTGPAAAASQFFRLRLSEP